MCTAFCAFNITGNIRNLVLISIYEIKSKFSKLEQFGNVRTIGIMGSS